MKLRSIDWLIDVPRFYFHIEDDEIQRDEVGTLLADAAAARREALTRAEALIANRRADAWFSHAWILSVIDDTGIEALRLTIRPQHRTR